MVVNTNELHLILGKQKTFKASFLILIYILVYILYKIFYCKSEILGFHLLFLFMCLSIAQGNLKVKFSSPPAFPHRACTARVRYLSQRKITIRLIFPLCTTLFLYLPCHIPLLPPHVFPQPGGVLGRNCTDMKVF